MIKRNPKSDEGMNNVPIPVRVSEKTHRDLKKLSYLTSKSMSKLARECIEKYINEHKNILINSDIMI